MLQCVYVLELYKIVFQCFSVYKDFILWKILFSLQHISYDQLYFFFLIELTLKLTSKLAIINKFYFDSDISLSYVFFF